MAKIFTSLFRTQSLRKVKAKAKITSYKAGVFRLAPMAYHCLATVWVKNPVETDDILLGVFASICRQLRV